MYLQRKIHSIAITQCFNLTWSLCGYEYQAKKLAISMAGFAEQGYHMPTTPSKVTTPS